MRHFASLIIANSVIVISYMLDSSEKNFLTLCAFCLLYLASMRMLEKQKKEKKNEKGDRKE